MNLQRGSAEDQKVEEGGLLDSLEMVLQSSVGSTYWCSLAYKHRKEGLIERGKYP